MKSPQWLQITDQIIPAVFQSTCAAVTAKRSENLDLSIIGEFAIFHISGCINSSAVSNEKGLHSAAICLLRQCVEALTIVDLALQEDTYREPLLEKWKLGRLSSGDIRKSLEAEKWSFYAGGLWNEPWSDFFGNLARSVHPYAHYSSELMGWQMSLQQEMPTQGSAGMQLLARIGPAVYDPVKASRITMLHSLVIWTLARVAIENSHIQTVSELKPIVEELRLSLSKSNLLFGKKDWALELVPHVWFKPGYDWHDE